MAAVVIVLLAVVYFYKGFYKADVGKPQVTYFYYEGPQPQEGELRGNYLLLQDGIQAFRVEGARADRFRLQLEGEIGVTVNYDPYSVENEGGSQYLLFHNVSVPDSGLLRLLGEGQDGMTFEWDMPVVKESILEECRAWMLENMELYQALNSCLSLDVPLEAGHMEKGIEVDGELYFPVGEFYFSSMVEIEQAMEMLLTKSYREKDSAFLHVTKWYHMLEGKLHAVMAAGFPFGPYFSHQTIDEAVLVKAEGGRYVFRFCQDDEGYQDLALKKEDGSWKIDGVTAYYSE